METGLRDRSYWVDTLCKVADPVLKALSSRRLKELMPVEEKTDDRPLYTHLEALGRLLAGMAPWLESGPEGGEEGNLRERYAELARQAVDAGTDPASPDFLNFAQGYQPIVDAAFLSHAIVRAPNALWHKLGAEVRTNVVNALRATRTRKPFPNNWLLFAAMIECALYLAGEPDYDLMRIDYALRQHESWYVGDGMYGDGPDYHADYYNSFVIQPMLLDILDTVGHLDAGWEAMKPEVARRAVRYADVQERMISPEGTFPVIGRSLAYRCGAFQHLAQMALRRQLPPAAEPAQVRGALTAVIRRTLEAPGTFDANGWLRIGLSGHQPGLGEGYISTGSLYLCATAFLPLGLGPEEPFWQGEADWTSRKAWSGGVTPIDKAL